MTQYFIDHDAVDAEDTTNTYTFTNGSTTVTVSGDQTAFWQADDFIRSNDATNGLVEWYRITDVSYDSENDVTNITIDHAFAQATHSAGAQKNSQYRLWKADSGASGNGQSPDNAFCSVWQYFQIASAGDVGYVRRNKTYLYTGTSNWSPSNDGTASSPIILMADDGTGWSGEETLSKPKIKLYYLYLSYDDYWVFKDLEIESRYDYSTIRVYSVKYVRFTNCDLIGNCDSTSELVIYVTNGTYVVVENCTIKNNNTGYGHAVGFDNGSFVYMVNCTIDSSLYGSLSITESSIYCVNCDFSEKKFTFLRPFSYNVEIKLKNCLNLPTSYSVPFGTHSKVMIEQGDTHIIYTGLGTIEKDNTTYTGNAASSVKVTPKSCCSREVPIKAFEWVIAGVTGNVQHTVTVRAKCMGYNTLPTSDDVWIEVEYINDSENLMLAKAKSTESFTANDTWTALSVTFTPAVDGNVVVRGYVGKYENGDEVVWFNGELEIT